MNKTNLLILFLVLSIFAACTPVQNQEDLAENTQDAEAIHDEAIKNSIPAPNETKNVELFDYLDKNLTKGTDVEYLEGYTGYLSMPVKEGVYPAVILIHEWWGLNENIKTMADLLAQEGYVVLAVDMYGEVATTPERARELSSLARSNITKSNENMKSAVAYLKTLENVEDEKIASLGWCFGGQQSLNLAVSGEKMAATVIYYGNLVNDTTKLSNINWPVLGIFGDKDTSIPVASVNAFEENLNSLNIENEIYIYPGVGHAFANPSGANYAKEETKDAWSKTLTFLESKLK